MLHEGVERAGPARAEMVLSLVRATEADALTLRLIYFGMDLEMWEARMRGCVVLG